MTRALSLIHLLLALGLIAVLPACPSGGNGDDDDATSDDDDATGDDDDDATGGDPCDGAQDATSSINGGPVGGSNTGTSDNITGTCAVGSPGSPEAVYSITPAIGGLIIVSTDHAGTGIDTVLYAFDDCANPSGSELACNDDIAQGVTASQIVFDGVAGQTVYIVVDGYDGAGSFEMSIDQAVCGDGVVAGNEQCDDGEQEDGDGCDSSCAWECVDDANEEDDDVASASDLDGEAFPTSITDLVLCPGDLNPDLGVYVDFFAVDVAEGEYLEVDVLGGATLTPTCAEQNVALSLLDADLNAFAGGETADGECARAVFEAATADTYYIAVYWNDQTVAPQDYVLSVDVGVSDCGDGEQTGLEECDDGDEEGGDGCSATCLEEDSACPIVEAAEGSVDGATLSGTTATATDEHEPQGCGFADGAADVVYTLTVSEDQTVIVSLENPGTNYDTLVYVRETCIDPGSEIACNDDGPESLSSVLFFDAIKDVTYYIVIDGYAAEVGEYEMSLTAPVCGDGTVDLNEACDDGDAVPGNGCENDCTVTPVCASAADDDLGTLATGSVTQASVDLTSATDTLPDLDCSAPGGADHMFEFEITVGGTLTIAYEQDADAGFGLFADDGSCAAGICDDPVGELTGSVTASVTPGTYRLVVEAWEDGSEGTFDLTITAP